MKTQFLDPKKLISQVIIEEKMSVADYGCNAGAFVIELAKKVGAEGEVLAVDILESALSVVKSRIDMEKLENVKIVRANLEVENANLIPSMSLDVIFLNNVLFLSQQHEKMIKEVYRTLRKEGIWVVIDWNQGYPGGLGPARDQDVVKPDSVQQIAEAMGFQFDKDMETGDYHWGKIFVKK